MGSSGGGSSKSPNDVNPAGQTTGYGSSTPFNPSYNSVLSNGMGWADTGEIDAANATNAQAVSTAQPAASTDGGYSEDSLAGAAGAADGQVAADVAAAGATGNVGASSRQCLVGRSGRILAAVEDS